jgi:rod shape-determining protein MreB
MAGDKMNESIIDYIRKVYSLMIGEKMAERAKIAVGCAYIDESDPEWVTKTVISGRDMVSGLPKSIEISSRDVCKSLEECVDSIIQGVKVTLENAPPELSADIINTGMTLAGGGAYLRGLDSLIERETGIRTRIADNAANAVALGTGKSLEDMSTILEHVRSRNPYQNTVDLYNENSSHN